MTTKQALWSNIQSQLAQLGVQGMTKEREHINEAIKEYADEVLNERLRLLDVSGSLPKITDDPPGYVSGYKADGLKPPYSNDR